MQPPVLGDRTLVTYVPLQAATSENVSASHEHDFRHSQMCLMINRTEEIGGVWKNWKV